MGWLSRLLTGEDPESREAHMRMAHDRSDRCRLFVWGILAASYDLDPGYLPEHARMALGDWYEISSAEELLSYTPEDFVANDHVGYNQFRLCFMARAGYGAGLLDESSSWAMAIANAAVCQNHYASWFEYGRAYLDGHLAYRAYMGDDAATLADRRRSVSKRLAAKQKQVWSAIPWQPALDWWPHTH